MKRKAVDIRDALYSIDENILKPEVLRQLLAYAPNSDEVERYDAYTGSVSSLSKPDQFGYQISRVPGFQQRLQALLFKVNFAEKVEEVKESLKCMKKASQELRQSKKLAKVLELVLAMGNHLNKGNQRVGQAAAFRIKFLTELDITKTSDNRSTFLHVLANAVHDNFPDVLKMRDELPSVPDAAKVSQQTISEDLAELRKVLQDAKSIVDKIRDISEAVTKAGSQRQMMGCEDRFQEVMGHFISSASDEIQSLFSLQNSTLEEYNEMVKYFGEDPKDSNANNIFASFAQFITKFEKAHHQNVLFKRH
ncbi:delphilin isoform X2 [Lingula anatina]|uniref:Delphilin isoform X2 n=1 Tax=Lingula anatina TaxID=7574 RepID=A0A2R2MQW4_LINAN|nr:delphilin isoform X2 [Lingula anatina]|eukprot:XP_023932548.1 delphilin isoform X2 [Lingula anatina]